MNNFFYLTGNETKHVGIALIDYFISKIGACSRAVGLVAVMAAVLAVTLHAWAIDPTALPTGGPVVAGQGSIATSGSAMTVTQGSDRMVANWNSFNIGQNASVSFLQPNTSSVALNRILDTSPSQIFGQLSANGQVFLLNPSGILFGPTARVDVGGLVASSLNMTNENFMAGRYSFKKSGNAGAVINQGSLRTANGGYIAFLAPHVENQGQLTTPAGTVALAAGDMVQLDFTGDSLVNFVVDRGAVDALAENNGLIRSDGGMVVMTAKSVDSLTQSVVNNIGVIEARTLNNVGGRILLDAQGGMATVSGTLDASSAVGRGGQIVATGDQVWVNSGAFLNASGATGGGTIMVGGGWQGKDSSMHNATYVNVDNTVTIDVSATDNGNGGTVVFWSDYENMFEGTIIARGGMNRGDGGQVEVSGKQLLGYNGLTDTRAPSGKMGRLLLDPTTINIKDGAGVNTANTFYEQNLEAQLTDIDLQTDASSSGNITLEDLSDNLLLLQNNVSINMRAGVYASGGRGNYLTVDTNDEIRTSGSGDITIQSAGFGGLNAGKMTATGTGKVRLFGDNGLTAGNTITTNGGIVELWADSDNLTGGSFTLSQAINSNGGNVYLDSGSSGITLNGDITTGVGRVFFDTFGSVLNYNIYLNSKITSTGDVTIDKPLRFGAGSEIETTGKITLSAATQMVNAGSALTLTGSSFDFQEAVTGNSATITLKPSTVGANIDIGTAALGDLSITAATLGNLSNFANIIVGRSDGNGITNVISDTSVSTSGYLELANQTVNVTGGTLTNTGGDIILTGDTFNVSKSVTANSGNGKITVRQQTAANSLNLGTGITDAIADLMSANTLEIGRTDGGNVILDGDISTTASTVNVLSGGNITFNTGQTLDVGTGIVNIVAGGNFINNSGVGAISTSGAGRWLIWSSNPANDTRGGLAYDFKQYNATYGSTAVAGGAAEDGFLYTLAPTITASLTGTVSKTYNATTAATLVVGNYSQSGAVDSDTVTLNNPTSGTYDNKNIGTGKTVTATGVAVSSASNGGKAVYGYQMTSATAAGNAGTITAANLAVTGLTASDKVYDATTTATLGGTAAITKLGTDDVTIGGTAAGAFADKNVADGKGVTVTGNTISGTDAGNYTLVQQTGLTADITAKEISATNITADDKTYDSTTDATIHTAGAGLSGVIVGDTTTLGTTSAAGYFIDPNVGQNKTVNVTGLVLSGTDAGNYTLTAYNTTASITGVIAPPNLVSPQSSINGTQLDQGSPMGAPTTPAMGPGGGSIMLASFITLTLVSDFSQTGGDNILSSTNFTAPVSFTAAGSTSTMILGGSAPSGTLVEVGILPIFTRRGGVPVGQGSFVIQESPSSLSLTRTTFSGTIQEIGSHAGQVVPFTLSMPNGMTLNLTASVTENGFLVINVPDSGGTIDVSQAVLMALMIMKNEQNLDIGTLKGVLLNQR
jgi:filamentous hemagglutinin family protein